MYFSAMHRLRRYRKAILS